MYNWQFCNLDRDDYVRVNFENIQKGKETEFEKYNASYVDPNDTPYDYGSVMHYGRLAGTYNGSETITPLQEGEKTGNDMSQIGEWAWPE